MSAEQLFNGNIELIKKSEMVIFRDVRQIPIETKEVICPCFILILNLNGTARLRYDMHEMTIRRNEIVCLMPNHVLTPIEVSSDFRSMLIIMSEDFIKELPFHFYTHDFHKFHFTPIYPLTEEQMRYATMFTMTTERIISHDKSILPHRHDILISLVSIGYELLNMCRREQDKLLSTNYRNVDLFNRFCNLVVEHYTENREVAFYAEKLMLTPKYFSKVINETVGMTASDWIERYVATQARNMLRTRPNLTVQEVGFLLGFPEQPSFCRFFKRLTGVTPRQYRKDYGILE